MGSCLKFFTFLPYGFDYLGFLTNARRDAMRSKTQWVFYRDLDWWPGLQKVQFGEITGYPEVVGLILALLGWDHLNFSASLDHQLSQCLTIHYAAWPNHALWLFKWIIRMVKPVLSQKLKWIYIDFFRLNYIQVQICNCFNQVWFEKNNRPIYILYKATVLLQRMERVRQNFITVFKNFWKKLRRKVF